jgi:hypothetical protein
MKNKLQVVIGFLTVVMLLLSSVTALAAPPAVTAYIPQNVYLDNPRTIFTIEYEGTSYDWRVTRTDNGVSGPVIDRTGGPNDDMETLYGANVTGTVNVPWDYLYDGDFVPDTVGFPHTLTVSAGGIPSTIVEFYINWMVDSSFDQVSFVSWYDATIGDKPPIGTPIDQVAPIYYSYNTVCSFGPHFRNVSPDLTDKWYMFTPIDLSKDGTQTYDLVGGNIYIIGKVMVTVSGDSVTVDYKYFNDDVWKRGDFFTFFADYDSITTVDPEEISTKYSYGEPISIAGDLKGDKDVLLFVRNIATFSNDNPSIKRFRENVSWYKELRESMLKMIGKETKAK